jgi:hypothetical protein
MLASVLNVVDDVLKGATVDGLLEIAGEHHLHGADQRHGGVITRGVSVAVLEADVLDEVGETDLITITRSITALLSQVLGVDSLDDSVERA